jgi:ArsR family transcriptional regulator
MDEIIVRLARAIASYPRLRILALLTSRKEETPSTLAEELELPLNVLSMHLRALVIAGLLVRRKSGAWTYYRAGSPYDATTVSGRLAACLKLLQQAAEEHPGLREVRDVPGRPVPVVHRTIFEAATAFTDLRRLQLLRYLDQRQEAPASELEAKLSMSPQALNRHMAKLVRRGYVRTQRRHHAIVYSPAPVAKTTAHGWLLDIVRASWAQHKSRTS